MEAAAAALKTAIEVPLLTSEQRDQIISSSKDALQQLVIQGLESSQSENADRSLAALDTLMGISAVTTDLRDQLKALPEELQERLPPGLLIPPPAVAPFDAAQAKAHQQAWADYLGVPVETTNSIGMKFAVIPPGKFMMGSPEDEPGREDDETRHKVTLTQPFQMGMHEVTQEQYEKVLGANPSKFKGPQNPVEQVSWDDAVGFCRKLSALPTEKAAGYVYRLPTEAEWEYACRAGTTTAYSFGASHAQQGDHSWFKDNSGRATHPVGGKKTNPWGLYDMYGNVWEWCQDWHGVYPSGAVTDPTGPLSGSSRLYRGGSWGNPINNRIWDGRSSDRYWYAQDHTHVTLGFRVVRSSIKKSPPPSQPVGQAPPPAVAPFDATQAKAHQQAWVDYLGVPVETTNSIGMKFAVIPPGEFMMGSPEDEPGRRDDETLHKVTLTQPFQIGMHEVTQEQYQKVMGTNPSRFKGLQNPVNHVSWNDAVSFCQRLSALSKEKALGCVYRLPTEAEWEYSCRAGTTTKFSFGDNDFELGDYAWHIGNSSDRLHPVGQKKPNQWGLHDMHGNAWEYCKDWHAGYSTTATTAPTGPVTGAERVSRGGTYVSDFSHNRSALRWNAHPSNWLGNATCFRVVRTTGATGLQTISATTTTPPASLNKGLVAYYPFTGNANDESGNGNDGNVRGAILSADRHGQSDRAYAFDGRDDFISASHQAVLNFPDGDCSLAVWAALADPDQPNMYFLGKDQASAGPKKWFLMYDQDAGVRLHVSPSSNQWHFKHPWKPRPAAWHHYLVTKMGSTYTLFLDGAPAATDQGASQLPSNTAPLTIGQAENGGWVKGQIDDVRIYNRALSPTEVKTLYDFESQPPGSPVGQAPSPAVAPFNAVQAKAHQQAWADHLGVPVETTNSIGMKFVVIPPGEFMMGSPEDEPGRGDNETLHKVTLTQPFQMGMHEVTQEQYQKVMGSNRISNGPKNPVVLVTWNEAAEFCRKLSAQPEENTAGYVYRLPTEAEWEYACRAGTTTAYSFGNGDARLGEYAWFFGNSKVRSHPVGTKMENPWKLRDMHGNVFEWCQDVYGPYQSAPVVDPRGPSSGSRRNARGGGMGNTSESHRSARRRAENQTFKRADCGFRVLSEGASATSDLNVHRQSEREEGLRRLTPITNSLLR